MSSTLLSFIQALNHLQYPGRRKRKKKSSLSNRSSLGNGRNVAPLPNANMTLRNQSVNPPNVCARNPRKLPPPKRQMTGNSIAKCAV